MRRPPDPEPSDDGRYFLGGLVDGDRFALDGVDEPEVIWGRDDEVLWMAGEPLMITAPTGTGKTTIAQQLTLGRMGLRPELLGYPITPGERVLYLACDRPQQIRRSLRRMVSEEDRDALHDSLVVWPGPSPFDFARHPKLAAELAIQAEADTVIIDSLKDVALKLSEDEVGAALHQCFQHLEAEMVEVVVLHHPKKPERSGSPSASLEQIYGSTHIPNGMGSILMIGGSAGDLVVKLYHRKHPSEEVGPLELVHDPTTGTTVINTEVTAHPFDVVATAGPVGMLVAEVAAVLFPPKPTRNDIEKTRRKLEELYRRDLLVRREEDSGGPKPRYRYIAAIHA